MLHVAGRRGQIQSTAHGEAPPRYGPHRLVYRCLFNVHSDTLYICESVGASPKVREASVSFRQVCLSAWNNSAPTGRIFMKFDI